MALKPFMHFSKLAQQCCLGAVLVTACLASATVNATSQSKAQASVAVASTSSVANDDLMLVSAREISLDLFKGIPESKISQMRKSYQEAVAAFKRGDVAKGRAIQRNELSGYPLNIWLDYYYLSYDISTEKFDEALQFIQKNEHAELSRLLKERYADYLSDEKDYARLSVLVGKKPFEESDLPSLTSSQKISLCRFYEANWPLNKVSEDAVLFANRIYLDSAKQPKACNNFLKLYKEKGYLSNKMLLRRFENAYILRSSQDTTQDLAKVLSYTSFKDRVNAQMELYDEPSLLFEKVKSDSEEERRIATLAFKRFANLSPVNARNSLNRFIKTYSPSDADLVEIYKVFASGFLGRNYTKEDVEWIDKKLPTLAWTNDLKEQRIRRAIYFAQWDQVYVMVDHLPRNLKNKINWRYWKGRAALEIGREDEGKTILEDVALDRSFFGFYAAQTLDLDYAFNYEKIDPNYNFPFSVSDNASVKRFLELYAMKDKDAIYEWREIARRAPDQQAMIMAQWALQTHNVNYAIDFVVSSQRWDALDYRFPIAWRSIYEENAKSTGVDLSFLYGISRQESMLNPKIKSWAGAVGLMQLMPNTAKQIANAKKWKDYTGTYSLTNPEVNVKYGSTYIKWMLKKFDNNRILAAAAYNAGPNRVVRWASKDGIKRDAAMYIESIPFAETRQYVQNVILYDAIYNMLLTGKEGDLLKKSELTYRY